jgi:tripartite-type tricarboxylate transporter receptor subunit TctC
VPETEEIGMNGKLAVLRRAGTVRSLWHRLVSVAVVLTAFMAGAPASAQPAWPAKPITLVLILAPGTGMDVIVRAYAERLSQALGRPVVVDNKPGGSGLVAVNAVLGAPADGHTFLVATSGVFAINQTVFRKLSYDPLGDFVPVSLYLKSPFILVVRPSLPVNSVQELVSYARTRDGQLSYSSPGAATAPQLAVEMMKDHYRLEITHVPYKSTPQSITDIVAGTVDLAFAEAGASFELIKAGKLRPLGVSSLGRLSSFTTIPPFAEAAGVPDFEAVSWHIMAARADTPRAVLNRMHDEMRRAVRSPEVQERMVNLGLIPVDPASIEDTQAYVRAEAGKWGNLVRKIGAAGTQ